MGALERARAAYGTGAYDDATIEFLFPELKDSEDERIRRSLVKYFRQFNPEDMWDAKFSFNDILAYLEKQKEQKPAECIEDSVKFEEGFKVGRESGLRDGQKYVLSNLDSYGLCKPAEWSERDKKMMNEIITIMDGGKVTSGTYLSEYVAWLKYLPERFNLQPKQEWSEEDEEIRRIIINRLTKFDEWASKQGYTRDDPDLRRNPKDWLLSLRPFWRPSKEQMWALTVFLEHGCAAPDKEAVKAETLLDSLYKDLEKL